VHLKKNISALSGTYACNIKTNKKTYTHEHMHWSVYTQKRKTCLQTSLATHGNTCDCNKLQHTATDMTATQCKKLQHTATPTPLQTSLATHRNTYHSNTLHMWLQQTATHCIAQSSANEPCNTLQHLKHCNTLQHILACERALRAPL